MTYHQFYDTFGATDLTCGKSDYWQWHAVRSSLWFAKIKCYKSVVLALQIQVPGLVAVCDCCCQYNAGEDSDLGREAVTGNAVRGAFSGGAPTPAHVLPEQPCCPGHQLGCTPGTNIPRVSSAWAVEVLKKDRFTCERSGV